MNVLVSGASGLIGSALVPLLARAGHRVARLVRPPATAGADAVRWNPAEGFLDRARLEGVDAVVHLSGESILGRWTAEKRRRLRDSRVASTRLLAEGMASVRRRAAVLVCASASGYYGNRGDEPLSEESAPGTGFLAELCRDWEAAAAPAAAAGIRVVHVRIGLVLAPAGGVLGPMLPAFRLGLGGPIGDGRQWWSWIALDDLIEVFRLALESEKMRGPINAVAPHPARNGEFAPTLARVLGRPAAIPVPPFALRLLFGAEAANEAMLAGARLVPARLAAAGFAFRFPELEPALRHLLRRPT